jgi:Tol biopolymer transport system component
MWWPLLYAVDFAKFYFFFHFFLFNYRKDLLSKLLILRKRSRGDVMLRDKITRRNFVKYLARLGGAVTLAPLIHACGGTTEPVITPENIEAIIRAPFTAYQDEDGLARVTLDGSVSKGPVTSWVWGKRTPAQSDFQPIGSGEKLTDIVSELGSHDYKLTALGKQGTSNTTHETSVSPAPEPYSDIAFLKVEPDDQYPSLYTMDINDPTSLTKELGARTYNGNGLSWDPTGRWVVLVITGEIGRGTTMYLYERGSGYLLEENILISTAGNAWQPSWSPTGEWIAYTDDTKVLDPLSGRLRGSDELFLINPETRDMVRPSGLPLGSFYTEKDFLIFHPSWFPDGESLAGKGKWLENGRFENRITIFYDLLSNNPKRDRLFSEEQVNRFRAELEEKYGGTFFYEEGANGIAVSPDGKRIAYAITFNKTGGDSHSDLQGGIALSTIDGSEDTKFLRLTGITMPAWTKDGKHLLFQSWPRGSLPARYNLLMYSLETEEVIDLSLLSGYDSPNDRSPTLWG